MGDGYVPLPDLDTENDYVVSTLEKYVGELVSNYSIDGLRLDATKNIRKDFWPDFAKSAGVFTIGEVLHNETGYVSAYTGEPSVSSA